jgi:hypothetical protein
VNKLAAFAIVVLAAACQPDTKNMERKIDALTQKVDQLLRQGPGAGAPAGGAAGRPPRVEPNPAKTYAVSIEGDHFEGPADAKVTIIEAYDYA